MDSDKPVGMLATFYKCGFLKHYFIQTYRTNPMMVIDVITASVTTPLCYSPPLLLHNSPCPSENPEFPFRWA